jgi:quercetin dioxygenase-like cupin family protein
MTSRGLKFVILAALCTTPALAMAGAGGKGAAATLAPASDLKWNDVPGFDGLKMAVVEGDPAKGPAHAFLKFAPGFSAPRHFHSANHYVTVLAGTLVLGVDGKDHELPAGSYFSFTGKKQHTTRCDAGAECILFLDIRSKWDVVPVAPKK